MSFLTTSCGSVAATSSGYVAAAISCSALATNCGSVAATSCRFVAARLFFVCK
ncbi:hypothetical protein DPMN_170728 [Dreissena polymorpha]|uniref:Uncharacterized protein n=1 Tax=Dreissena polymorpha TaxID=45954 RepID=A0A9D4IDG2_DREPO|nr:hypothetical protein DPMN_170728 [Dreissena polymorpha]